MKKAILILLCMTVFFLTASAAFAAEDASTSKTGGQYVWSVMKRGVINFFTFPGEVVRTAKVEKENHPKAVYVTYLPRVVGNLTTRLVSSVNDMAVMPWYVWATKDERALASFFDLPDYVWEKT